MTLWVTIPGCLKLQNKFKFYEKKRKNHFMTVILFAYWVQGYVEKPDYTCVHTPYTCKM